MLIYEANFQRFKWNTLYYMNAFGRHFYPKRTTSIAFLKACIIFQAFPRNRDNALAVVWATGIKHTSVLKRGILRHIFSPSVKKPHNVKNLTWRDSNTEVYLISTSRCSDAGGEVCNFCNTCISKQISTSKTITHSTFHITNTNHFMHTYRVCSRCCFGSLVKWHL